MRWAPILAVILSTLKVALARPPPGGSLINPDTSEQLLLATVPPIPSNEEILRHMHNKSEVAGRSLFFSGVAPFGPVLEQLLLGYQRKHPQKWTHEEFWLNRTWLDPWDGNRDFWVKASAVMAWLTSGDAWVLLPSNSNGTDWNESSVWNTVEWPILKINPAVRRVIRVNPDDDRQEIIFENQRSGDSTLDI